ncbi:helix-turn-helix transcriptional regulator [Actinomadura madurae]|uniref:helix-turn-helix transcriptional regulator n=1 Tax=Actinomadura madurae TaxID=1993 RepID=UPI0020D257E3|nr:WYL domain-containing protein [Actinomadura madurae]MCP9980181.1 WYL domain-containing protein [Actinomadura madurae]
MSRAGTGWPPGRPCPRCCSTTTRPSPSPSDWVRSPPKGSASKRHRSPHSPSWSKCCPHACAGRVEAVRKATSVVPGARPPLDLSILGAVAAAIRGHERLRFGYTKPGGSEAARHTEPQRLVSWGSLWYLLAWDLDRDDWRIFRVDRMVPHTPTGERFQPRVVSEDKVVEYVVRRVSKAAWKYRARVLVHAPAAKVAAKIRIPVDIEVVDESTCHVELGSDDPDRLALWMTQFDLDIEVIDGDELAAAFDRLATRFRRAAGGASTT